MADEALRPAREPPRLLSTTTGHRIVDDVESFFRSAGGHEFRIGAIVVPGERISPPGFTVTVQQLRLHRLPAIRSRFQRERFREDGFRRERPLALESTDLRVAAAIDVEFGSSRSRDRPVGTGSVHPRFGDDPIRNPAGRRCSPLDRFKQTGFTQSDGCLAVNVLAVSILSFFLFSDDHAISAYQCRLAKIAPTPNIERLALAND